MPNPAVFNRAAESTIARALAICTQRGDEYQDSWAIENMKTPFLTHTLATVTEPSHERTRLILLAALADVKLSRLVGAWKDDTAIDLINYVAAYAELRNEYEEEQVPNDHALLDPSVQHYPYVGPNLITPDGGRIVLVKDR